MKHSMRHLEVLRNPTPEALGTPPSAMAFVLSRTSMLKEVWEVLHAVSDWPEMAIAPGRGGMCLSLRGVTLGHLRWDGRLDLPFDSEVRDRLVAEEMAIPDPDHPKSGRLIFDVRTLRDVDRAVWLLRLAYLSLGSKLRICSTEVAQPPSNS